MSQWPSRRRGGWRAVKRTDSSWTRTRRARDVLAREEIRVQDGPRTRSKGYSSWRYGKRLFGLDFTGLLNTYSSVT
jgi:hypothetical protein